MMKNYVVLTFLAMLINQSCCNENNTSIFIPDATVELSIPNIVNIKPVQSPEARKVSLGWALFSVIKKHPFWTALSAYILYEFSRHPEPDISLVIPLWLILKFFTQAVDKYSPAHTYQMRLKTSNPQCDYYFSGNNTDEFNLMLSGHRK